MLAAASLCAAAASKADQELMACMETWKQAMLHRDGSTLEKLYHPDLTYSHSSGKTESKREAIEAVVKGPNVTEKIEMSGLTARVYGATGLVKGNLTISTDNAGKKQTLQLSVLHVFLKGPQGWQMVARQSTRLNP